MGIRDTQSGHINTWIPKELGFPNYQLAIGARLVRKVTIELYEGSFIAIPSLYYTNKNIKY